MCLSKYLLANPRSEHPIANSRGRNLSTAKTLLFSAYLLLALIPGSCLMAQAGQEAGGIPINNPLVIDKCGGCHTRDDSGAMMRISYVRTTPEIWEQILKRMVRLNGLTLSPEEARQIVRYLSDNNGLAPQEAKPAFWDAEHRLFGTQEEESGTPAALQRTCNYCHTVGRALLQRRTAADYIKLANTHMALFPGAETAVFRPNRRYVNPADLPVSVTQGGTGYAMLQYPQSATVAGTYPLDTALQYLAKNQPLITPEWTAWKAQPHSPKLIGTWLVSASQAGKGRIYGKMTVAAGPTSCDFVTTTVLHYPDGQVVKRTGKGVLYTGYSWRGHSTSSPSDTKADPGFPADTREAMLLSEDGESMQGRWFWGGYQEFGLDVQLSRLGHETVILGVDKSSLRSPSTQAMRIYGANLPSKLQSGDFNFGEGVQVGKILHATADELEVQVNVAPGLSSALHKISVRGKSAPETFAVYDKVSYIKVAPDASFARLGGTITAKQFTQFEAVGYANGPDGLPGTADDIALGPVPAAWSLEEFYSTPNDDDVNYVGSIDDCGLFTPALEGPNPQRKKQANNYPTENWGDVWVAALYKGPEGDLLKARSYLVVTIPTYVRYDQPEVSQ
jgi:quinohemoprotein amine dehydrogenase